MNKIAKSGIASPVSILLNHLQLQIVKVNLINKAVLIEADLCVPLKIPDIRIQPDRQA